MTVQELIDELMKIQDKTLVVTYVDHGGGGYPDLWEVQDVKESECYYHGKGYRIVEGRSSIVLT